jgi:CubicO group peptidase (beta-lactamase class C family)
MSLDRRSPELSGFRPDGLAAAAAVIDAAVRDRVFPGAVLAIGKDDALVQLRGFGALTYDQDASPVVEETIYDLASVTKVVATTTMAMLLVDEGRLDVAWPVSRLVPEWRGGAKDGVTIAQLLAHTSGLPGWRPLFNDTAGRAAYVQRINGLDLEYVPGTQSVYSDLGFIVLGAALEEAAGEPLDVFVTRRILEPLGMTATAYRPPAEWRTRIAPTEDDPWRGRVVHGEVHDENACAMGGVAGHAGLFGTAGDLARFASMIAQGGTWNGRVFVGAETLERFATPCGVPGSSYALGWDMPSREGSSAGRLFSRRSIGHLGYAGTSLWIDRERRLFLILLSNRVHPSRSNDAIRRVRPALADAVIEALE